MIAVSLQIKGVALVGSLQSKHQVGDITDVYPRSKITGVISPDSSLVFVHVTDMPITSIEQAWVLNEPYYSEPDPEGNRTIIYRHNYFFDLALATEAEVADLTILREITTTWARVKQVLKRRDTGALITDGDLNG